MSVSEIVLSPTLNSLGSFPHLENGEFLTNLIGLNVASAQPGGWHMEGAGWIFILTPLSELFTLSYPTVSFSVGFVCQSGCQFYGGRDCVSCMLLFLTVRSTMPDTQKPLSKPLMKFPYRRWNESSLVPWHFHGDTVVACVSQALSPVPVHRGCPKWGMSAWMRQRWTEYGEVHHIKSATTEHRHRRD